MKKQSDTATADTVPAVAAHALSITEQKDAARTTSQNSTRFPIAGLGASAGGLAAFEAFFSGMPPDTGPSGAYSDGPGMTFVLVQHLAPDHESILTDLIRRYTRMQVFEVEDGMIVQPNCTYIIPPGRDMALRNGTLQLLEPTAPPVVNGCPLIFSSARWRRTSTNGPSVSCFRARAVTAPWGFAPSRTQAAWSWYRIPNPPSTTACRAVPLPPDW